ncbi:MAG TPA: alkaline phosphatase family protein [Myxococcota bacterium]
MLRSPLRALATLLAVAPLALAACAPDPLRVTIIGIDGATWDVIDPLFARGELPNLRRIVDAGVRARLRSEQPLVSPAVWTTVATGVSRREHGLKRFAQRGGELVSARERRAPALWTLASRGGLRAAAIGWWGTYPAEPIHGVVVSERAMKLRDEDLRARFRKPLLPARLAQLTYPPEVLELLAATLFRMPQRTAEQTDEDFLLERLRVEDAAGLRALAELRERTGAFDLELLLLRGVDPVSHVFWRYHEPGAAAYAGLPPVDPDAQARYASAVEDHYRFVDALLGELPAQPGPRRAIFLLSDHGFEAHWEPAADGTSLSGHHRSDDTLYGIFVAAGGPLQRSARLEGAVSIYDIAPTVLHLLGLEVADTLPGAVREDLLAPDWVAQNPVRGCERYPGPPTDLPPEAARAGPETEVDQRLREELRALGYIE